MSLSCPPPLLSPPAAAYHHHHLSLRPSSSLFSLPKQLLSLSSLLQPRKTCKCLAQITSVSAEEEEGPIELPPSQQPSSSIFATSDNDPSTLQVATSVLLTGAISVFLFRSLRRRAKRVKDLQFRSSGTTKRSLKEEAIESLKAMTPTSPGAKGPPSPVQTLLGGISAGVIALILYKFATTVEGSLNRQTLSNNFSVRQITITIRTIINGLCYLATFVFGLNSIGLILYSGQLALSSFMEDDSSSDEVIKSSQMGSNLTVKSPEDTIEGVSNEDQTPDGT